MQITDIMTRKIDACENFVELNEKIRTNNEKIRYLSYIENLLKGIQDMDLRTKEFNPVYTPLLVETFEKIMIGQY